MANDEPINPENQKAEAATANGGGKKADHSNVELWQTHPQHTPVTPHHALNRVERRRAENAAIRRWMELGDQALKPDPEDDSGER